MKERPILFSALMVNAILEGRKIQTRRMLKVQPPLTDKNIMPLYTMEPEPKVTEVTMHEVMDNGMPFPSSLSRHNCPYGKIGDHLWVRETFRLYDSDECPHADFPCGCPRNGTPLFKASHDCGDGEKWTPSIHMPRWASRILLEITNIRVERLQDISESDCLKEGVGSPILRDCKKPKFMQLWESINGADSWAANPWVWVVEFKVVKGGAV
ncbi:hypothetical protein I9054_006990 [Acinetobacter bereziniae]|uniref:Uncharacterized protein n=1 Tax=Acinetobacter bereziniae TaxID=106648 RepID=A0A8I1ADX7_ACIBZ|nr:hypothetical protein [Acinetobacter bereziniae]UUN99189.1 hypothetical protein I9054_006990 [Acinetobacter bereziniae]